MLYTAEESQLYEELPQRILLHILPVYLWISVVGVQSLCIGFPAWHGDGEIAVEDVTLDTLPRNVLLLFAVDNTVHCFLAASCSCELLPLCSSVTLVNDILVFHLSCRLFPCCYCILYVKAVRAVPVCLSCFSAANCEARLQTVVSLIEKLFGCLREEVSQILRRRSERPQQRLDMIL